MNDDVAGKPSVAVLRPVWGRLARIAAVLFVPWALAGFFMRGAREGILTGANDLTVGFTITKGRARVEDSTYHPEFGCSIRNQCLVVELEHSESIIAFSFGVGKPSLPKR